MSNLPDVARIVALRLAPYGPLRVSLPVGTGRYRAPWTATGLATGLATGPWEGER
jgi:hypothetical protein